MPRDGQQGSKQTRVAIVTGAGSGIGRATALRLATDGYRVTLAGRREWALQQTAHLIADSDVLVAVCDVTEAQAVNAMVSSTVQTFGRIDVVVNNAGISRTRAFPGVTIAEWREVMAADVESIVLVTEAALPALSERGGSVVNVASVAGLGGDPGMSIYNTAKGAVVNLTRSLAVELAARGVRVNAVAPSLTTTDATADIPAEDVAEFQRRIPMGRAAEPAEVADVIAFLAGSDARFVTGVVRMSAWVDPEGSRTFSTTAVVWLEQLISPATTSGTKDARKCNHRRLALLDPLDEAIQTAYRRRSLVTYVGETGEASAILRHKGVDTLQRSETTSVSFIGPGSVTNQDFGLFRWNMTAEAGGAGTHFHRTFSESFYVRDGAVTLFDGTDWGTAGEGDFLYVPPGGVHGFRNDSGADASMLILFSPGIPREKYFQELAEITRSGRTLTDEEWADLFARHDQVNV